MAGLQRNNVERRPLHHRPIQFNSLSRESFYEPNVVSESRPVLRPIDPARNRPAPIALRRHHEWPITDRPRLPPVCAEGSFPSGTKGVFPTAERSAESSSIKSLTPYLLGNNDDDQYSDEAGEDDDTQDDEEESSESAKLLRQENQMKSRSYLIRGHWDAAVLSNLRYSGSLLGLDVNLLRHQRTGVRWMLGREVPSNEHPGGLLCDDMGLGKTIQSISLILLNPMPQRYRYTRSDESPVLVKTTIVIVPKSLLTQWVNEINDMAPHLNVLAFEGSTGVGNNFPSFDVVVTTYTAVQTHSARANGSAFDGYEYWRVILDEAHTIRNVKTKTFKAVCTIYAWSRWCLTGTPLHNSINDIQALLQFIRVPPYDDYEVWKNQIGGPLAKGSERAMTKLQLVLSCVMYRRTKAVLKKTLKARRVHRVEISFLPGERAFYDRMKASVVGHCGENGNLTDKHILVMLLRLQQLCNHQSLVATHHADDFLGEMTDSSPKEEDLESVSAQMASLGVEADEEPPIPPLGYQKVCIDGMPVSAGAKITKILEYLTTEPRKTIIFSQFVKFFDILGPFLERERIRYVTYSGGVSSGRRDASLNVLRNNPEPIVLLCSLKCGSLGLNLTSANRVIMVDPWWNPMVSRQAIDRVYRIGQTVDVDVYELYVAGTVEEKILELQGKKSRLADSVMSCDEKMMKKLQGCTRDELMSLLIH